MNAAHETPKAAARRLAAGAIRDGFVPEALHVYTDADGRPVYWRIRAKNSLGEKWIRPMKFDDAYEMGEPPADRFPAGKPLYLLHTLAARPGEVILVVEGENKADKLSALGLLATTSGGADSAGKADWQPLAGRDVLIWPDYDAAGTRYAESVASALRPLGCRVQLLAVDNLGLAAKGDAVDWLAAHPQASAQDVLALPRVGPHYAQHKDGEIAAESGDATAEKLADSCEHGSGTFTLTETGVFFTSRARDGNEKSAVWVCSLLLVIAKTRDPESGAWGRLLEWLDDDGVRHQWAMPLELLEGDGTDVRRELARLGLRIGTTKTARDLLAAYLKVWPVDTRARCVDRLGWAGALYITPTATIGSSGELTVFQNGHALEPALSSAGDLEGWRESVARMAAANSRLVFALSVAFAGPLLDLIGEDSGGFHLRGKSSSGKSTALKAAASVWGQPEAYARVWRATANGLEGLAALHNDNILILDELGQCDPREAGEAAYLLANGQGKARAARNGTARPSQRWRVLFLSAGEESLTALMARAGRRPNAGQEIRLADFDADAGAGMGAFERLNGHDSPAALAQAIKDAASRHYGTAGVAWLHHIVEDRLALPHRIGEGVRQFVAEVVPAGATGQVERVARRFAVGAVAGEFATHFGLTGWEVGEAEQAAKKCFAAWLEAFGGVGNREERAILEQVRAFFEANGAARFESMSGEENQRVVNRAGFYRIVGATDAREFLVLPEAFKNEVCKGLDAKAALSLLLEKGWIQRGGDGRATQKPRLPGFGTAARVYVFTSKMWEDGE